MKTTTKLIALGAILALAGCAETQGPWRTLRKPVAAAPPTCGDFQSSVYFEQDSAALTREAKMVLSNAQDQARGCAVKSVRVIGLADAVGTSDANLALSRRRAQTVTEALAKVGFGKVDIDAAAVGDAGAVAASGAAAPLRRRADILFAFEAR
ncbi:OmpA family protein [Caulobacter sp. RL271]|jgi:outer membrane protein OmpA-like peptidoglycan-associated protein|uniref:OmpA family protein n=1 Tax=Caulobacter segnis TaxID=88688 RepID=A0ABY4ZU68_9CAUL|nr:OmpA family protein [Caulobacter segnis]USQ96215.1 OmpA family protein [Caulobacter segnis]